MTLGVMVGPVGDPPKGIRDNQWVRLEEGRRNLTVEEAWRLADLFPEIKAFELLLAARAVSPDSSPEFKQAIEDEAERRRRGEARGFRRYEMVLATAATALSDQPDPTNRRCYDHAGQPPALVREQAA